MIKTALFAAAVTLAGLTAPAQAGNGPNTGLELVYKAATARLNADMAAFQKRIIAQNIADPRVMAAWRSGACGRGLSAQQVAYVYAATAGCTPQGLTSHMQNERRDHALEMGLPDDDKATRWHHVYLPSGGWAWVR